MRAADEIVYALEPRLGVDAYATLLKRSGLGRCRPLDEPERLARMLAAADIVMTARSPGGTLLGVVRALTDFAYCCYVCDLAIDPDAQRRGIEQVLIRKVHEAAGPGTMLIHMS
ncbi:MAG TPA: GNAT family N-acetyltransferase [Stellaceae bacterium]|jgi:ribosomal protein S18 acetylase RimI-like enzyme|nr:GNAT family N-acetyltransferase [Stellaceae bacterium]